ncbi:hypothetical protein HK099_005579 [Clydaea vesicula]|uniref:Uncharacterized protein n=1 Tax=Clydaea vesicula TaxID=447962 RepID=A0AAD5XYN2_9FUNG|nr:hypothetical protein HK099_005579 [Clydaea vesicula]
MVSETSGYNACLQLPASLPIHVLDYIKSLEVQLDSSMQLNSKNASFIADLTQDMSKDNEYIEKLESLVENRADTFDNLESELLNQKLLLQEEQNRWANTQKNLKIELSKKLNDILSVDNISDIKSELSAFLIEIDGFSFQYNINIPMKKLEKRRSTHEEALCDADVINKLIIDQIENDRKEKEEQIHYLRKETTLIKLELDKKCEQIQQLKSLNETLKTESKNLKTQNENVRKEKEEQIHYLAKETTWIKLELEKKCEQIQQLESLNETLKTESENLKTQIELSDTIVLSKTEELQENLKAIKELSATILVLEKEIIEKDDVTSVFKSTYTKMASQFSKSKEDVDKLSLANQELRTELETSKDECKILKMQYLNLESLINDLSGTVEEYKVISGKLETKLLSCNQEKGKLLLKISELEKYLGLHSDLLKEKETEIRNLRSKLDFETDGKVTSSLSHFGLMDVRTTSLATRSSSTEVISRESQTKWELCDCCLQSVEISKTQLFSQQTDISTQTEILDSDEIVINDKVECICQTCQNLIATSTLQSNAEESSQGFSNEKKLIPNCSENYENIIYLHKLELDDLNKQLGRYLKCLIACQEENSANKEIIENMKKQQSLATKEIFALEKSLKCLSDVKVKASVSAPLSSDHSPVSGVRNMWKNLEAQSLNSVLSNSLSLNKKLSVSKGKNISNDKEMSISEIGSMHEIPTIRIPGPNIIPASPLTDQSHIKNENVKKCFLCITTATVEQETQTDELFFAEETRNGYFNAESEIVNISVVKDSVDILDQESQTTFDEHLINSGQKNAKRDNELPMTLVEFLSVGVQCQLDRVVTNDVNIQTEFFEAVETITVVLNEDNFKTARFSVETQTDTMDEFERRNNGTFYEHNIEKLKNSTSHSKNSSIHSIPLIKFSELNSCCRPLEIVIQNLREEIEKATKENLTNINDFNIKMKENLLEIEELKRDNQENLEKIKEWEMTDGARLIKIDELESIILKENSTQELFDNVDEIPIPEKQSNSAYFEDAENVLILSPNEISFEYCQEESLNLSKISCIEELSLEDCEVLKSELDSVNEQNVINWNKFKEIHEDSLMKIEELENINNNLLKEVKKKSSLNVDFLEKHDNGDELKITELEDQIRNLQQEIQILKANEDLKSSHFNMVRNSVRLKEKTQDAVLKEEKKVNTEHDYVQTIEKLQLDIKFLENKLHAAEFDLVKFKGVSNSFRFEIISLQNENKKLKEEKEEEELRREEEKMARTRSTVNISTLSRKLRYKQSEHFLGNIYIETLQTKKSCESLLGSDIFTALIYNDATTVVPSKINSKHSNFSSTKVNSTLLRSSEGVMYGNEALKENSLQCSVEASNIENLNLNSYKVQDVALDKDSNLIKKKVSFSQTPRNQSINFLSGQMLNGPVEELNLPKNKLLKNELKCTGNSESEYTRKDIINQHHHVSQDVKLKDRNNFLGSSIESESYYNAEEVEKVSFKSEEALSSTKENLLVKKKLKKQGNWFTRLFRK